MASRGGKSAWRWIVPALVGAVVICGGALIYLRGAPGDRAALQAFQRRVQAMPLTVRGEVVRVLPDDQLPPRHQRFLIKTSLGQTLLVLRNLEVSQRVPVNRGDRVEVCGEYRYNLAGGLVHEVHRDPSGRGPDGWIRLPRTRQTYR